jgi:hypothetical protein
MRLIRFGLAALVLLLLSQVSFSQGTYETFVSREDFFSVVVPCKIEARDITWLSEFDNTLPGRVYSCNRGPETYTVTVINYTDVRKIHESRERNDAVVGYWRTDVNGSIAYACMKLRQEAAKVTFDAYHQVDRIPGMQLQYTNHDGTRTFAAVYLHAYRLYILKAAVPPNTPPPGIFQQSLSVLNAEGNRIRYNDDIYRHP